MINRLGRYVERKGMELCVENSKNMVFEKRRGKGSTEDGNEKGKNLKKLENSNTGDIHSKRMEEQESQW